jgi:hypothetical protein
MRIFEYGRRGSRRTLGRRSSMRKWISGVALVGWISGIGLGGALILPGVSAAEGREFVGQVVKISETKIVVENRRKDKMDFIRSDSTVVAGDKSGWKEIREADRVSVTWDVGDKPRTAHHVKVLPPDKRAKKGRDAKGD